MRGFFFACLASMVLTSSCATSPDKTASTGPAPAIDMSKDGVYKSGRWEYKYSITLAGSKSEGYHGALLFDGKPAPGTQDSILTSQLGDGTDAQNAKPAEINDYYQTPWGNMYWVGQPVVAFGVHGWMLKPLPSRPVGKKLPEPGTAAVAIADAPVVMMQVLFNAAGVKMRLTPPGDDWVVKELGKFGVEVGRVDRDWFRLTDQAVTIVDNKMVGTLTARLANPKDSDFLTVILDGSNPETVRIPRKDKATLLVKKTLSSGVADETFFLAFRVDAAVPDAPKAVEIGAEADGKTVVVKGASRVLIKLPGDRRSGLVWTVESVKGEAVKADGEVQYTPNPPSPAAVAPPPDGFFETAFKVVGKGKVDIDMAHKRTWQDDVPPAKTFHVTLEVQ
jgi:inhibitor of cysteine peptidase